jgi:hypothetical protein
MLAAVTVRRDGSIILGPAVIGNDRMIWSDNKIIASTSAKVEFTKILAHRTFFRWLLAELFMTSKKLDAEPYGIRCVSPVAQFISSHDDGNNKSGPCGR